MKSVVVFIMVFCWQPTLHAQMYNSTDQQVYACAVNNVKESFKKNKPYFMYDVERPSSLKTFPFRHPNYVSIDTNSIKLNEQWLMFLKQVDTAKIITKPKGRPLPTLIGRSKRDPVKKAFVVFSAQIISADRTKAILGYDYFGRSDFLAGGVILLEKQDEKWVVVKVIRTSIE